MEPISAIVAALALGAAAAAKDVGVRRSRTPMPD
jgi:hypothetical protein